MDDPPRLFVIMPTRGRPARAADAVETAFRTCTERTWFVVVVDADDPAAREYDERLDLPRTIVHIAESSSHVSAINAGADMALRQFGDHVTAIAKLDDDHRPRTVGWDARYLDALRDLGTGIVYGNDLLQGGRLPTAPAMTADIVRALGHYAPPVLRHLYCDDYWRDLGQAAACLRYLPDVVVEHMHPAAGKAPMDDGYRRVNSGERYAQDGDAYERYKLDRLPADVASVRDLRTHVS